MLHTELTKDEMEMFLMVCKLVRMQQEYRKEINELHNAKVRSVSGRIWISFKSTLTENLTEQKIKREYALRFSLVEKGFMETTVAKYLGRQINLSAKGIGLVKELKRLAKK